MSGQPRLGDSPADADGPGPGGHWVQPDLWGNIPTGPLAPGSIYVWIDGQFKSYPDDWT